MLSVKNVRQIYAVHGIISLSVILAGISANYFTYSETSFKKFIPVDTKKLQSEYSLQCSKAYANVLTDILDTKSGGIICCSDQVHDNFGVLSSAMEYALGNDALCIPTPSKVPLLKYLTKFPHCWIMVICPLIFQLFMLPFSLERGQESSLKDSQDTKSRVASMINRAFCYLFVMLFRGNFLYAFCDTIENSFTTNRSSWEDCWFASIGRSQSLESNPCRGLDFDFSDHIVFFYAHMLPIVLFEFVVGLSKPLSIISKTNVLRFCLPLALAMYSFYITSLTLMSAYRTAKYFHTPAETIMGYAVSLLVQIPLGRFILKFFY